MKKILEIFKNRWFKFTIATIIYILLFVVWTGNLWLLLGLPLIFDYFISRLAYRYIGSKNDELRKKYPAYNTIFGWVDAILWATVVATLVHLFIFQLYVVPTSSMEKTILIGDYLYVSKLSYGPQVPNTPVAMPFVFNTMPFSGGKSKSYSECIKWDYHRLSGRGKIEREDVVVFNYPAGDTILIENQAISYYDELRSYQAKYGKEEGRKRLYSDYTVTSHPVDKRENYIKRRLSSHCKHRALRKRQGTGAVRGASVYLHRDHNVAIVGLCIRKSQHHRVRRLCASLLCNNNRKGRRDAPQIQERREG